MTIDQCIINEFQQKALSFKAGNDCCLGV